MLMVAVFLALFFLALRWTQDWRKSILSSSLAMGVLAAVGAEFLSLAGGLAAPGLRWYWGVWLVLAAVLHLLAVKPGSQPQAEGESVQVSWVEKGLLAWTGVLAAINAIAAYQTPPNNWDSMVYHLPRVMHWLRNGSVNFYATHIQRQLFLSPGIETFFLHWIGLTGSDQWVNFFGILVWLGGAILASLLAKEFRANPRAQGLAALLCLAIPTSILQAGTPKNDLLVGFWILAAILCGIQYLKAPTWLNSAQLGAAIGLALFTKNTAVVLLAPFVIWFIVRGFRQQPAWKFIQHGLLVTLMVALLVTPHLVRTAELYGSPLGPPEETAYYRNQVLGVRVLVSNTVRNLSMHFRGPAGWNDVLRQGIQGLHTLIGINPSDPRTTWQGYRFDVYPLRFNEDEIGAPLQVGLFVLAVVLLAVSKPAAQTETRRLRLFALLIVAAFLLFSGVLRWQLWQVRLLNPLVILACVVAALVMERKFPRWLIQAVLVLVLALGSVSIWQNPTKPLPGLYDYHIFNLKRPLMMIYDLSLQPDYMAAIEALNADLRCNQIGLVADNADWEYPFWVFVDVENGQAARVEHVLVENQSRRLLADAFEPCAVLVMTTERPETVTLPSGQAYQPFLTMEQLGLYTPSTTE